MKKTVKSILNILLMVLLAIVFASCQGQTNLQEKQNNHSEQTDPNNKNNQDNKSNEIRSQELMQGVKAEEVNGKVLDDLFFDSQFKLTVDLFKRSITASENKNVLISPLSILLALSMTANGADGETKSEMESVLGNGIKIENLNEYIYSYIESLPSGEKYKLSIANSIWYRDMGDILNVKPNFLQTNANYYGAQLYKSPFDNSTVEDINNWVDTNTDGMIKKIIEYINKETIMYLINALAFDAEWKRIYSESDIHQGIFTSITNEKQEATMMNSMESIFISDRNAKNFIKPYADNKYSFAALLPNEGVDIYEYINSLTGESLANTLKNAIDFRVYTTMPKFTYEYQLTLNDILIDLGISRAFDPYQADLSKMVQVPGRNVYISSVLHKTFIKVDERGTKAGAVTAVEIGIGTSYPTHAYYIKLDKPFVYMIIDNETKLPIFIGALVGL